MVKYGGSDNVGSVGNTGDSGQLPKHQQDLLKKVNNSAHLINIYDANHSGDVSMDELMSALNGGKPIDNDFGFGELSDKSAEEIKNNASYSRKTRNFHEIDGKSYTLKQYGADAEKTYTAYEAQFNLKNEVRFIERTDSFVAENGSESSHAYLVKGDSIRHHLSYDLPDGKRQSIVIEEKEVDGNKAQVENVYTIDDGYLKHEIIVDGQPLKTSEQVHSQETKYFNGKGERISWLDYDRIDE